MIYLKEGGVVVSNWFFIIHKLNVPTFCTVLYDWIVYAYYGIHRIFPTRMFGLSPPHIIISIISKWLGVHVSVCMQITRITIDTTQLPFNCSFYDVKSTSFWLLELLHSMGSPWWCKRVCLYITWYFHINRSAEAIKSIMNFIWICAFSRICVLCVVQKQGHSKNS